MQAIAFIKELEKLSRPVITLSDVLKIIGKNRAYTRVYIHRLVNKNVLFEVEKGKYTISEDPFEIASNLVFPSYISFISAYSIYGLTTQTPLEIQIVSLKSKKPVK